MTANAYTKPDELASELFGLRFSMAATEQQFSQWRIAVTLPNMRLGMVLIMMSWLVGTPILYLWDPAHSLRMLPFVALMIVPTLLLGLAFSFHPLTKRWAVPIVSLVQFINGCSVIYLFYILGKSPGSTVVWCVYGILFCPFMRLPPFPTLFAAFPFAAWLLKSMMEAGNAVQMTQIDAFTYVVCPIMTLVFVVVMCASLERIARQTFVLEQIIGHQARNLKRNGELIRRYIPRSVADHIDAGDGSAVDMPRRMLVTVLFSDIVGFTALADRLDAASLTHILATYMSTMVKLVEAHGGTLNEFAGDGLMSIFGAPSEMTQKDQAIQAIKTAQAMQSALSQLNESWKHLGFVETHPLSIRIGINTGELSVGSFGSEGRMTYTAIGLQTNVAARIQAQCKPGSLLLSGSTWQLVRDDILCEQRGALEIKGVQFLVPVYEPI